MPFWTYRTQGGHEIFWGINYHVIIVHPSPWVRERSSRKNSAGAFFEGQFGALAAQQTDMLSVDLSRTLPCHLGRPLHIPCRDYNATLLNFLGVKLADPVLELVQGRHGRINLNEKYIHIKNMFPFVLVSHMPQPFTVLLFDIRTPKFSLFLCHSPLGWPPCAYLCTWTSSLPCPHLPAEKAKGKICLGAGRVVLSARWWKLT